MTERVDTERVDVAVVGAGPIGIACARECAARGLRVGLLDEGPLCAALYRYPRHMTFFSTAERIAVAGIPFPCVHARPTRDEGLAYYRGVARHPLIAPFLYRRVEQIAGAIEDFRLATTTGPIHARRVIIATGFFHHPVPLAVPGEELPQVSHYFIDGHAYAFRRVVIVGGANSAVIAALECRRQDAQVTLIHRGPEVRDSVKYWLRPDLANRIAEGAITAHFQHRLTRIAADHVVVSGPAGERRIDCDAVLALTGYRGDFAWLRAQGLRLNAQGVPEHRVADFESLQRPGLHLAGCVLCGEDTGSLFIENGREHAGIIAERLRDRLTRP